MVQYLQGASKRHLMQCKSNTELRPMPSNAQLFCKFNGFLKFPICGVVKGKKEGRVNLLPRRRGGSVLCRPRDLLVSN